MASGSRLVELVSIISTNTEKIDKFLSTQGFPHPSFDVNGPADFPVPAANEEIQAARREVIVATPELHDLCVGPRESIRWMAWNVCTPRSCSCDCL